MTTIDCYFDYASPFAYFLSARLDDAAARAGTRVVWKPVELGALPAYAPYGDAKRRYVVVDALRSAEFHGVPIRTPEPFPVRSGPALRATLAVQAAGAYPAFRHALFTAAWRDARDIGDPRVLAACAGEVGVPPALCAGWDGPEVAAGLAALTAEAAARGVFGVPTMCVDGELFWGNDRLDMLRWRLAQRAAGGA